MNAAYKGSMMRESSFLLPAEEKKIKWPEMEYVSFIDKGPIEKNYIKLP